MSFYHLFQERRKRAHLAKGEKNIEHMERENYLSVKKKEKMQKKKKMGNKTMQFFGRFMGMKNS